MKRLLLLCMIFGVGLFGCGLGKDTSGTLTLSDLVLTDLGGGTYSVATSALYTPDNSKDPTGADITFTASYTTPTVTVPVTKVTTVTLGKSGIATFADLKVQGNEPVYVSLSARTGGLSETKIAAIPAVAALTVSPSSVAFLNTDPVGTFKLVTVTGGYSPYTAVSDIPGDISADISGAIVTITADSSSKCNSQWWFGVTHLHPE